MGTELTGDFLAARQAIFDFYMRTAPGAKSPTPGTVAVCPNQATPPKLLGLLDALDALAKSTSDALLADTATAAAIAALEGPWFASPSTGLQQAWNDLGRLRDRLASYRVVAEVAATEGEELQPCAGTTEMERELSRRVILPLFFGHYPADLPPFVDQPPPFNGGEGLSDLSNVYIVARQGGLAGAAVVANLAALAVDTRQRFGETMELVAEGLGLGALAVAGVGLVMLARALRR